MFRTTDIVLIAVMVAAAGFTYTTKHSAEAELSKLRKLEASIRFEEETIDLLKADWSLMTQPSRLQKLAEAYQSELNLVPIEAYQITTVDELPARELRIEDLFGMPVDAMASTGIDKTITSGVTP
jgi:hypothetical protein